MAAKHTPPGDASFRTSLLRSGAGAVGLVAAVALIFGLIGGLGPATDAPLVADGSEDSSDPAMEPGPDDLDGEPDDDSGDGQDPPQDADAAAPPDETDQEPSEQQEEPADSESDEEGDAGDRDGQIEPEEPEDDASGPDGADDAGDREFPPDSVTVQVLDGYQDDGGSAAASVAAALRDIGYRVVAENPSLRYEATTVLWTAGFEAQAHQVAADLGGAEVRPKPDNLSDQVQVHVVVGADRA